MMSTKLSSTFIYFNDDYITTSQLDDVLLILNRSDLKIIPIEKHVDSTQFNRTYRHNNDDLLNQLTIAYINHLQSEIQKRLKYICDRYKTIVKNINLKFYSKSEIEKIEMLLNLNIRKDMHDNVRIKGSISVQLFEHIIALELNNINEYLS